MGRYRRLVLFGVLLLWTAPGRPVSSQPLDDGTRRADTVDLASIRAAAARTDPRSIHPELLSQAGRLRLAALRAGAFPQVAISGEATVQSDTPQLDARLPAGSLGINVPHQQYRFEASAEWAIYDGGIRRRQSLVERIRLDEQLAGARATVQTVVDAATETYFAALLLDAQRKSVQQTAEAFTARLDVARVRAREGAALQAEAAVLEAELIRVQQQELALEAERRAALVILSDLTGLGLSADVEFVAPDLQHETAVALTALALERPELTQLDRRADRIRAEARAIEARMRPTLSLFGRGGVGRPSPLDFLSDEVQPYGIVGMRLRWAVLDAGRARREAQSTRLQAAVLDAEREALARQLVRATANDVEAMRQLEQALELDERAVTLRAQAAAVAARQMDEGVLLPDVYAARIADLADARMARERHRLELARAHARILTALGRYPAADQAAPRN